ncbi:MAG: acetylglutamate kinase [Actinomycetota bacterium]|nr:acetylglutamate kinase [Actinomycetota bacterium]
MGAADELEGLSAAEKAEVLVEALPYIRRFRNTVAVVKYGGNAMTASMGEGHAVDDALALFAEDVALLRSVGMGMVVVHGGGPQIGELMARLGKVPRFVDGLRVTDAETLDIVRMVLVGKVNRDIASALNLHGTPAVGVSGEDAGLLRARARSPELGFVGDIDEVRPAILERLLNEEIVPVVATIGADDHGHAYNINADTAAGAIAAALRAEKLVYLTDVEGLWSRPGDPGSVLSTASVEHAEAMIEAGTITAGMVPKIDSCVRAVRAGVGHAHILDGRVPHVLLLEIFTRSGIGTMISA